MPTISQLVRSKRKDNSRKSKSPALQFNKNTLKKVMSPLAAPQRRGVLDCQGVDKRNQSRSLYGAKKPKAKK